MPQTIEVRFKGTRRSFFTWNDEQNPPRVNTAVIVSAERGKDLGRISAVGRAAEQKCGTSCGGCGTAKGDAAGTGEAKLGSVLRIASTDAVNTSESLRRSEEEVRRKVMERVQHHGLAMKVSDAEWQWDRKKLTVYFTAENRVDFRALVRDLASLFRTRIDLRQIGVRDEAARLGGVGRCGREYCCSTWLTELSPVSLGLAKDQRLALNPAQISGGCGRLLCCLKYEHDFYVSSRRRYPKEGKTVQTSRGEERVLAVDIFREQVHLRHPESGNRVVALAELRRETSAAKDDVPVAPAPETDGGSEAPDRESQPVPTVGQQSEGASPEQGQGQPPKQRRRRRRRRRRGPPKDD